MKEAIEQHLDELYYYPESGSPGLRKVLSEHLNVDESRIFGAGLDEVILMTRAVLTPGDKIVTSEAHSVNTIITLLLNPQM